MENRFLISLGTINKLVNLKKQGRMSFLKSLFFSFFLNLRSDHVLGGNRVLFKNVERIHGKPFSDITRYYKEIS